MIGSRILLIIIFSSLFSYSQSGPNKADKSTVLLKGKIIVPNFQSIPEEGVHVQIFNKKLTRVHYFTKEDGHFQFDDLQTNTTYKLMVLIYGFQSQIFEISTNTKEEIFFNIDYEMACKYHAAAALEDWNEGNAKLLLASGIASYIFPKSDSIFKARYGIEYYDFGCNGPSNICLDEYNSEMFKLLDKKFGVTWRADVREYILN